MESKANVSPKLLRAHQAVAAALAGLETQFHKGCELTFVMRDPRNVDGFMVISSEKDLDLAIDAIQRSKSRATTNIHGEVVG